MKSVIDRPEITTQRAISIYFNKVGMVSARLDCNHAILIDGNLKVRDIFGNPHICDKCSGDTKFYNEAMRVGAALAANHIWTGVQGAKAFFDANHLRLVPEGMPARNKKMFIRGIHTGFFKSFKSELSNVEVDGNCI